MNLSAFETAVTSASNSIMRCGESYRNALSLLKTRMQEVFDLHVQVKTLIQCVLSPNVTKSIENTETNHPLSKDADSKNKSSQTMNPEPDQEQYVINFCGQT